MLSIGISSTCGGFAQLSVLRKYGFSHEWRADHGAQASNPQSPVRLVIDHIGRCDFTKITPSGLPTASGPTWVAGPPAYIIGQISPPQFIYTDTQTPSTIVQPDFEDWTMVVHIDTTGAVVDSANHIALAIGDWKTQTQYMLGYFSGGTSRAVFRRNDVSASSNQVAPIQSSGRMTLVAGRNGTNLQLSVNGGSYTTASLSGTTSVTMTNIAVGLGTIVAASGGSLGFGNYMDYKGYHWGFKRGLVTVADSLAIHNELTTLHS